MKKLKLILLIVVIALLGALFYQNKGYFLAAPLIVLNLYFRQIEISTVSNVMMIVGAFVIGVLLSYFMTLAGRFKTSKLIKNLNDTVAQQQETISSLKARMEQPVSHVEQPTDASIVDTVAKEM
ncbi:lipopolysaccharide assembly protein LapA domain-containing protein [Desulfatirhabdium butyrativorans]|uniref:lipopolysaccharide assembly protein LapA domain-containing protein n=1 Tax=Desulfatirhabdium butyrativorans TaxID=340467 RepID=UPI00041D81A2|nr:LapA family protein [Desulfatirhabdium butyrativorans]